MTIDRILYTNLPASQVIEGDVVNGRKVRRIETEPSGLLRFRYLVGACEYWHRGAEVERVERARAVTP